MWEAIVLVLNEDYIHPKHTLLSRLQLQATCRCPADVRLSDDVSLTTQTNRAYETHCLKDVMRVVDKTTTTNTRNYSDFQ